LAGAAEQPTHLSLLGTTECQHKSIFFAVYATEPGTGIAEVLAYFAIGFVTGLETASRGW